MSAPDDVVAVRGDYRARVVYDECPVQPDGDFFGAVYDLDGGRGIATLLGACYAGHGADLSDAIRAAWMRWQDDDMLARYLGMFYDVAGVSFADRRDWKLVAVVTAEDLRHCWGYADADAYTAQTGEVNPAEGCLREWVAWVDGDVWGAVIEHRETYANVNDPESRHDHWEEVWSMWGYYGSDDVVGAVLDELGEYAGPESVPA